MKESTKSTIKTISILTLLAFGHLTMIGYGFLLMQEEITLMFTPFKKILLIIGFVFGIINVVLWDMATIMTIIEIFFPKTIEYTQTKEDRAKNFCQRIFDYHIIMYLLFTKSK
jgi:hypothetical protein